jgi:hypothetical protein
MRRLLRNIYLLLALVFAALAVLMANQFHSLGLPFLTSKRVFALGGFALFCGLAAWRFRPDWQVRVLLIGLSMLFGELLLQAAAWGGVLPGVNTKDRVPFGRVYWTFEGRGNSLRNRWGWHAPEFNPQASRRVAVIGDSFVEAVEVGRNENEAAVLQELLRARSADWAVFGLGDHGTSPAYHLEVLDYAWRHFAPQEAVVLIFLGNDLNESSPALNYAPPEGFIYYDLDAAQQLTLLPASAACREQFIRTLEQCHRPVWINLPGILASHCMVLQMCRSISDARARSHQLEALKQKDPEAVEWGRMGLSLEPFALAPGRESRHALEVMLAEILRLQQRCSEHKVRLRLATIPFFPQQFYSTQHGEHWTLELGKYDFLAPDREIGAFAQAHDISFLSFAEWLRARKTSVDEIRTLYFFNGSGHFTPAGHRLCAQALLETFYPKDQP